LKGKIKCHYCEECGPTYLDKKKVGELKDFYNIEIIKYTNNKM